MRLGASSVRNSFDDSDSDNGSFDSLTNGSDTSSEEEEESPRGELVISVGGEAAHNSKTAHHHHNHHHHRATGLTVNGDAYVSFQSPSRLAVHRSRSPRPPLPPPPPPAP